jgi:tetratricopeptide (TPR) repeat protein
LFLAIAVLSVYWQVIRFDFVNLDDPAYVSENHVIIHGITSEGIKWAFKTVYNANWHPLTWISHMLDVQLFGMNAGMQHLTNVILHILNSILLFLVLERMTGARWRSTAVATLFALHPMHVESVAWISERKDVLSTFFWMLTMLGYIWYVKCRSLPRYLVVALLYILGLLSKPMLVTLPFVLLLLDFWPLKQLGYLQRGGLNDNGSHKMGHDNNSPYLTFLILEKMPLITLAMISSGITIYAQRSGGAVRSLEHVGFSIRIVNAIISYVAYLEKMVWPISLAIFYPLTNTFYLPTVLLSFLVILLITGLILLNVVRLPYLAVGWFWYLGTLIPVIGIVQVGAQSMADRYSYIPFIGIFLMIVWGVTDHIGRWRNGQIFLGIISTAIFVLLMIQTWIQVGTWKNTESLYLHALTVTKNNYAIHEALGKVLYNKGDLEGAVKEYSRSLEIQPNYIAAHYDLGKALTQEKRYDEAIIEFGECLKIDPKYFDVYIDLGNLMLDMGDNDEAVKNYVEAYKIDPHQAVVYINLGTSFIHKGNIGKAIEYYQKAVRIQPDNSLAIKNLENAKILQSKIIESITELNSSLKDQIKNPELYARLGDLYRKLGDYEKAEIKYQEAITLQPKFIQAMYGLVFVYSELKNLSKALDVLQNMRQIQPDNPEIYYNIACIYAKQNMSDKSIEWLKQSIEKGFNNWGLIKKDTDLANIRNTAFINELIKNH